MIGKKMELLLEEEIEIDGGPWYVGHSREYVRAVISKTDAHRAVSYTHLMEGMGVEPIEAVGKEFNPDFHNAVMHVEDEAVGENIVVEELQKGYTYKGFVVRHSMVKVAN